MGQAGTGAHESRWGRTWQVGCQEDTLSPELARLGPGSASRSPGVGEAGCAHPLGSFSNVDIVNPQGSPGNGRDLLSNKNLTVCTAQPTI